MKVRKCERTKLRKYKTAKEGKDETTEVQKYETVKLGNNEIAK